MDMKGFNSNEISKHSGEALKSDTWQIARNSIKTEIKHFTNEIYKDNPYGYPWEQAVEEYLKNGYKEKNNEYEFTALGNQYKVLKRENVTVFYDADGNTLFDVENERLEMEYENVMEEEKSTDLEKEDACKETGETQEEKSEEKSGNDEPSNDIVSTNPPAIKQKAKEKLENEMKADKDKSFAEPVIGYLLKRCEEDVGLAQDVIQEHKTWSKCFEYIFEQARKQVKGNKAAVRDDVVYEWAEDYYHKDDKAEEEKKAKEAAERKRKADKQKKADKRNPKQAAKKEAKTEERTTESPKHKKNSKEIDGQMDMFLMMGM